MVLTLVLLPVSCTSLPLSGLSLPDEESTICFRLKTGPETYSTALESLEEEKEIRSVSVLLFEQGGKFVTLETLGKPSESDPLVKFVVRTPGNYQLLVVTNHLFTEAEKQWLLGKHLSDVSALQISDAPTAFVMTSQPVNCAVALGRLTDLGVIHVTRLAVRIDIVLPEELDLASVSLHGRESSAILSTATTSASLSTKWSPKTKSCRVYTYEDGVPGATSLTVSATFVEDETYSVTVPLGALQRNSIYRLKLTMEDFGLYPN